MLLTWYLDKVIPSTNDVTKKPWFVFSSLIKCFKKKEAENDYLLNNENLIDIYSDRPIEK